MPKRPCPSDETMQPIKKQLNSLMKTRKIRSSSSERSLQLLYQGAIKCEDNKPDSEQGCNADVLCCTIKSTSTTSTVIYMKCDFCDRNICPDCTNFCYKCKERFCLNCSFPTYDIREGVCISCYG